MEMGLNGLIDKIKREGVEQAEKDAKDIILTSSGCAGLCSHEPMLTVEVKDQAPVKYVNLDADKTSRIFEEHVIGGNPVAEYALSMGSETTH